MIERAKLEGLRRALERDGAVEFPKGGKVWIERRIVVQSAAGAKVVFRDSEIEKAYELAMRPIEPLRDDVHPDPELDRRWGADPPF